jgi:hypothetical protein
MRPFWILGCLLCLAAMQTPATAQNTLKWSFQRTGFRSMMGTSGAPQTALSMRSNQSWPVVYGLEQGMLNAYSLFPVTNTGQIPIGPATNWHQIGTNLTGFQASYNNAFLQADSGSPDGFGVSLQMPTPASVPPSSSSDVVVVGNSIAGFQSPQVGAQAIKFDDAGAPLVANSTLLPKLATSDKIFDIATSSFGDVAALTQSYSGNGVMKFWQRSPLLGGNWLSTDLPFDSRTRTPTLYGPSVDLVFDASARPHILGLNRIDTGNAVTAYIFDVTLGAWSTSVLDGGEGGLPTEIADVAAATNADGIVGAAWVNRGVLKYAYLDTNEATPQWVVTTVANTTPAGTPLALSQGVGLAFDKAGLPVISFVDLAMRQIWIAYDPPSAFGGSVMDAPGVAGDFNGDALVDEHDLSAWKVAFGEGGFDGADFLAWQRNVGGDAPVTPAAVPEPATLASGIVALALLLSSMRSSRRIS